MCFIFSDNYTARMCSISEKSNYVTGSITKECLIEDEVWKIIVDTLFDKYLTS